MISGASLHLDGLSQIYPDGTQAVHDVSLEVEPGRILTLLGPSGSGKTTTLRMIAGFERPNAGTITLGGRDISDTPPHARDIGMVFQNYALFPHMTVFDNVAFPLKMRRWTRAEIEASVGEALALVQLDTFAGRFPRQLSGGQQQRVALARAIVFRPPLLLMDEPLGALDRQLRKSVQSELKRIQRQIGLTVVYVTHDQEEAMFLSDRIAIMQGGRIVQNSVPEELYARPTSYFAASFFGESNFLHGHVASNMQGRVSLTMAKGTIQALAAEALEPGMRAAVLVRPEKLQLYPVGSQLGHACNCLHARVEMVNFLGSALEYELEIDGVRLTARVYQRTAADVFQVGDTVMLGFSPNESLAFAAP